MLKTGSRLSIFPLPGALLLPRAYLPLHIFEPRYRALVSDSLARDRRIAMIQPRPGGEGSPKGPGLFEVGCVGKIAQVEALEDGRFNLILEGLTRFRMLRELDANTAFRQVEASFEEFAEDEEDAPPLPSVMRAEIEREARAFAEARGYAIDWDSVERLDDESLVNGMTQAIPFDIATKQALLEASDVPMRADLLVDFLRFGAAGDEETLQ
ncbi:LON peptidase substrate-binding domain-containing protein [Sphingomonas bacterium]|uniref:LON peptidase substrate-binding domain-containing protein n=1 Tax=Sphingomonas bacterium TaxID=1895847 RepID=UPI0015775DAD|nr:LON peptidase substrate-binding domain-containing protein [Sphingomonas bacterium]